MRYPAHRFTPEDLVNFIELKPFTRKWAELGLTDDDLEALQVVLMAEPKVGAVVKGTGGLRKMRFAPPGQGKRGGLRVCYVYYPEFHVMVLAIVYPKTEKDDLSASQRAEFRTFVERQRKALESGKYW